MFDALNTDWSFPVEMQPIYDRLGQPIQGNNKENTMKDQYTETDQLNEGVTLTIAEQFAKLLRLALADRTENPSECGMIEDLNNEKENDNA